MDYEDGGYLAATGGTWHLEDAAWKAGHVADALGPLLSGRCTVIDIGCGAGGVCRELARRFPSADFIGADVSGDAIELATAAPLPDNLRFVQFSELSQLPPADVVLALDVFEHVDDYLGFLRGIRTLAPRHIFHIPLDVSVVSVLRSSLTRLRYGIGHLHHFTADTAQATLTDCGYELGDVVFTAASDQAMSHHRSAKGVVAAAPRRALGAWSPALSARVVGGWSLLVTTSQPAA